MPTLALILTIVLFILGVVGTVLPVLPGTVIAFAGVFVHKLWMGDASVGWNFVLFAAALALASQLLDVLCTWWGAKRFGASWKGALGAVLGGLAGMMFLGFFGIILGPIVGAVLFEILDNRTMHEAARAGVGTLIGGLVAFIGKMAMTGAIIAGFFLGLP